MCQLEKSAEPVEPTWNKIENSIKRALETIPGKLSRPKGHPWVDRDIVRMIRRRDRMFKRNCRFPSIAHELEYDNLCLDLKKRIRYAKTHYLKHLSDQLESGNSKPLYNYLQRNSGRSNKITGLSDTDTSDIADKPINLWITLHLYLRSLIILLLIALSLAHQKRGVNLAPIMLGVISPFFA